MIEVPERGFAACHPHPDEWPGAARDNASRPPGTERFDFVPEWRREVWQAAREYAGQQGAAEPVYRPGLPDILSGHQPYPFHPGVLFKYLLLARQAGHAYNALWVSVDTDPCEGFPARIPSFNPGPETAVLKMQPHAANLFYRDAGLDKDELKAFARDASERMAAEPESRFEWGADFLERKTSGDFPATMPELLMRWRREYAGAEGNNVAEVPLSMICRTEGYYRFAFAMLLLADTTRTAFNAILNDYRNEHKIRSKANPFPDLEEKDGLNETLFWSAEREGRSPLFAAATDGKVTLLIKGDRVTVSGPEELKAAMEREGLDLWPRAVGLSIMQRICLGDLFVHGAGGAKYDRVTNALIVDLFDSEPPTYAAASFTPRPEGLEDPSHKLAALRQQDREIEFHPENYLEDASGLKALVARKERLIEDIKQPGADKKTLGREIKEINARILEEARPAREMMQKEIRALEAAVAHYETVADRELPFFLFHPGSIPSRCP